MTYLLAACLTATASLGTVQHSHAQSVPNDTAIASALISAGGFGSRVDMGPVVGGGERSVSMSFFYNHQPGRDCLRNLRQGSNPDSAWAHICEKSDKDGALSLTGTLQPIANNSAHAGLVTATDGSIQYQLMVSQAQNGFALVALRRKDDQPFVTTDVPENTAYDRLGPAPTPANQSTANSSADPSAVSATAIGSTTINGYRVFGDSGISVTIEPFTPPGTAATAVRLISKNPTDCLKLASNVTVLERACEKMDKDGVQQLVFSGDLQLVADRELAGGVALPNNDLTMQLEARPQGSRLAALTVRGGGRAGTFMMLTEPAMFERLAGTIAPPAPEPAEQIEAYRLGALTVAQVRIVPSADGLSLKAAFKLDAKVGQQSVNTAMTDCYRTVPDVDLAWGKQCEKAAKDEMPFEISGTLTPVSWRQNAFSGLVTKADGGWAFQMLVVNPQQRLVDVALSDRDDINFQRRYTLLAFDTTARPLPGQPPLSGAVTGAWKLPQESQPNIGFDLEMQIEPLGAGLAGDALLWFRAETDEISGYCPSTQAMFAICERIQKDGPLRIQLSMEEPVNGTSTAWRGTATPVGWNVGPFPVDFFKGNAIPDWGDEDPQAHYLRFRSPDRAPGGEAMAWLKVEMLDRAMTNEAELAAIGTLGLPPVDQAIAPPSAAQVSQEEAPTLPAEQAVANCEALSAAMQRIQNAGGLEDATKALSDAGFWGGILPVDAAGCAQAVTILSNANLATGNVNANSDSQPEPMTGTTQGWPTSAAPMMSGPIGGFGEQIELTTIGETPIVRVPPMTSCMSNRGEVCAALIANPGEHAIMQLAEGAETTTAFFNLGGDLFALRIDALEDRARRATILKIDMQNNFGLGTLQAASR